VITRVGLKAKLVQRDEFKLVMVLGEWAFQAKHIPVSLNVYAPEIARKLLDPDDDIGGGLLDWEDAGFPLEGDMVEASPL